MFRIMKPNEEKCRAKNIVMKYNEHFHSKRAGYHKSLLLYLVASSESRHDRKLLHHQDTLLDLAGSFFLASPFVDASAHVKRP